MKFEHISVMLDECIEGLNLSLDKDGVYFDGTLGGGGHSLEILKRTSNNSKLIATDLDVEAISSATQRFVGFENKFTIINDNFKNFKNILEDLNIDKIDGAILDLGVSSYQLDNRERGFSYLSKETKLDMRMNSAQEKSAYTVVNTYDDKKLSFILSTFGEEKFARNIAKNIVASRQIKPIETTGELVDIIDKSIPYKFKQDGHPARRSFQAIRIEVNEELYMLDECIRDIVGKLKSGGRLVILTFHSLEDRIVKQTFADLEKGCICDKRLPICVCNRTSQIIKINKKPITARENERTLNSRSKCAKLRIVQKI